MNMDDLAVVVQETLASYYEELAKGVHEWVDPLTTEQIWSRPFGFQRDNPTDGNSVGHLLLHLTGNLNYYIGAQIVGTGYVRNRPLEFSDAAKKSKEQVLGDFDHVVRMVVETIRKQKAEDWMKAYTAEREPESKNRFTAFFRCAAHAYHHVGQIIYLAKELAAGS
jgi:Protein of unknown function (DUF1572)